MKRFIETPTHIRKKLQAIKKPGADLQSLLRNQIDNTTDLIKKYWHADKKSESVCLEIHIDTAQQALKSGDRNQMLDQLETLILFYEDDL